MATWDDVRRAALDLPETSERTSGHLDTAEWRVRTRGFVWERPLRRTDREALGAGAPDGPILGVYVEDLGAKQALLAEDPDVYFTTPHFDDYPVVLVRLDRVPASDLTELIVEAWLVRAPKQLVRRYLEDTSR